MEVDNASVSDIKKSLFLTHVGDGENCLWGKQLLPFPATLDYVTGSNLLRPKKITWVTCSYSSTATAVQAVCFDLF